MQGSSAARITRTANVDGRAATVGLARHGTLSRKTPRGTLIDSLVRPESHTPSACCRTVWLTMPGERDTLEAVVAHAERAASVSAADNALRRDKVGLPDAIRWVQRRVRLAHAVLVLVTRPALRAARACVAEVGAVRTRSEPTAPWSRYAH